MHQQLLSPYAIWSWKAIVSPCTSNTLKFSKEQVYCTTTSARPSLCIVNIVWFTILKHHWRKIKSVLIPDFYLDSMFYNASYTIGESFSTRVLFSRCFLVVALIISFYRCEKLIKRAPCPDPIDGLLYVVAETPCRSDSLLFERLGLYFIVDSLMILGLFKPIFDLPVWS